MAAMSEDEVEMFLNVEFALWASRTDIDYDLAYERREEMTKESFFRMLLGTFSAGVGTGMIKAAELVEENSSNKRESH